MRILFADKVPQWLPPKMEEAGCTTKLDPSLEGDALTAAIASFAPRVLVVRSTRVGADQLRASSELGLVLRAGAGVNTIDLDLARELGIKVANCPGMNAAAVAELTIGHLVNLDRRIADNVADLRAGRWAKKEYGKARGLKGRTLGLLGLGNIGSRVARIALAMEMEVLGWDPFVPAEKASEMGVEKVDDHLELASRSDAVSIHLAEVPSTRNLVDRAFVDAMRPGAFLVNTSRAGIVEKEALLEGITNKGIRAALDVFWEEPPAGGSTIEDELARHPAVYGTHHIGASTQQAQDAVGEETYRVLSHFLETGEALNWVNPPR